MKELFYKYFSGEASKEEEKRIMDYAESSDLARREFTHERKLWDAYTLFGDLKVEPARKQQPLYIRALKIAVFLAIVCAVGGLGLYLGQSEVGVEQTVQVSPGSCVELKLADGSKVWLNANSVFSYPSSFGKDRRTVTLSGEGYFEVEHSKQPFIVRTEKYDVEVTGTAFNVDAYPDNEAFTTSLLEGSVKIHLNNAPGETDITLRPDEYFSLIGAQSKKGIIEDKTPFLWRNGIIYFDNESFPIMIKKLKKYYHLNIEIQTPAVMDYHCTGKFRQAEGIDHILRVLQKDLDFKYRRDDNQTIIIQ